MQRLLQDHSRYISLFKKISGTAPRFDDKLQSSRFTLHVCKSIYSIRNRQLKKKKLKHSYYCNLSHSYIEDLTFIIGPKPSTLSTINTLTQDLNIPVPYIRLHNSMSSTRLPSWYESLTDTSNAKRFPTVKAKESTHPGFAPVSSANKSSKGVDVSKTKKALEVQETLKIKKAWELAIAPGKALPMNLIMSYMTGNSLQVVPITMTCMVFFINPIKQALGVNQQFDGLKSKSNNSDIQMTKLVFILCQLLCMGAGVWKLGQMGLLPNTRSDWLSFEDPSVVTEVSV